MPAAALFIFDQQISSMFKSIRIHLIAIAVFFLVTAVFNAPVFSGKVIEQNDIKQYKGSASEIHKYRENKDRQILWTNVMFAGMPSYVISAVYGGELLKFIPKVLNQTFNTAITYPFLLMVGFYILVLALGLNPLIGIAGALAYGFSTYFIIVLEAGHNAKIHAMAYVPGILAGMIWAYRRKKFLSGAAIFALFTGLELTARHPQMFYYFLFLAIPYGLWELAQAFREKGLPQFFKSTALLLVGAALALGANLPYLSNTYQYGKHTIRGKSELTSNQENRTEGLDRDYVTNWSYGKSESFSLIVPNFKGGATSAIGKDNPALENIDARFRSSIANSNSYFGDQPFTSGPVYAGAIVVLLAFLAFFFSKGSFRYLLLGVFALSMALAWGQNLQGLTDFFLDHVPFYNKFRAVASFMVIPELILPILAVLSLAAISQLDKGAWNEKMKLLIGGERKRSQVLYFGIGLVSLFLVLNLMSPSLFNSFLSAEESSSLPAMLSNAGFNQNQAAEYMTAMEDVRIGIFKADVMRSLLFVALGAACLLLFQKSIISKNAFIIGIAALILFDLFPVNKRYLNSENFVSAKKLERNYGVQASPADQAIMAQYANDPYFRTLNLAVSTFNDASTSFFHYSLGGYHGAKLKIYQELVEHQLGDDIEYLKSTLSNGSYNPQIFDQLPALNMLNTRYVIINPNNAPLENRSRLGNAWLVANIIKVNSADEEITALKGLDAANTAVLRAEYANKVGELRKAKGSIRLTSYDPEKLEYSYNADQANLAVFSEIFYPDHWVAKIDNEEVEILRANYVLRALKVPAGQHTITFEYRDKTSGTSNTIALISSLLILLAVPGMLFLDYKKSAA